MYKLFNLSLILSVILGWSMCHSEVQEDYDAFIEKSNTGEGNVGSGPCPVGVWYSPACGDPKGVVWTFTNQNTGSTSNKDCNGVCTPFKLKFTYQMTGNQCKITYLPKDQQDYIECTGYEPTKPAPPSTNPTITLECTGNELIVNGSQRFTK